MVVGLFNEDFHPMGSQPVKNHGKQTQMLLVWNIYLHLVKNGYIQGEM